MSSENPYAAPSSDGYVVPTHGELARDGDVLIAPPQVVLPALCVKCTSRIGLVQKTQKFEWIPRWVYFLLLLNCFPFLIGALIARKRSTMTYSLCPDHFVALRQANWTFALSVLGLFGALALAIGVGVNWENLLASVFIVVAAVGGVIWISYKFVQPHQITVRLIAKTHAEYKGIAPEALDFLVDGKR